MGHEMAAQRLNLPIVLSSLASRKINRNLNEEEEQDLDAFTSSAWPPKVFGFAILAKSQKWLRSRTQLFSSVILSMTTY